MIDKLVSKYLNEAGPNAHLRREAELRKSYEKN